MLKSLHIEKFRCFDRFEISELGRVNLLTGYNNGGKTTVLEAIETLLSLGKMNWLFQTAIRRGETTTRNNDDETGECLVNHFFHGHNPKSMPTVQVNGVYDSRDISVEIRHQQPDQGMMMMASQARAGTSSVHAVEVSWNFGSTSRSLKLPVIDGFVSLARPLPYRDEPPLLPLRFLSTESFALHRLISWFDQVVLTPDEELLLEAIHLIDPGIQRIASIGDAGRRAIHVRYDGVLSPLPIGNLGDGVSRILCIALGLVTSANGVLLIDEIDTGLHYTTLEKMWRFVYRAAKRLNVQVFATTHSGDCIKSLAAIADEVADDGPDAITIQHIDCERRKAIGFDRRGVVVAAERDIEVR